MLCKHGKRVILICGGSLIFFFFLRFFLAGGIFNKTFALVGYQKIIANTALPASLAFDHLISIACWWNNCSSPINKNKLVLFLLTLCYFFLKLTIKDSLRSILSRRPYKNCSCQKRDTFFLS